MARPSKSEKLNFRMTPALHARLVALAEAEEQSLNDVLTKALESWLPYRERHHGRQQKRALAASPPAQRPGNKSPAAKVGRNDPCPCGSGRKAKHCHPENC